MPYIGCECAVCTSDDPHNKRLRPSVLVRGGEKTVVIDTGPDFRTQMLRAKVMRMDAVIITHFHADHFTGIDDVRRFNLISRDVIDCWSREQTHENLKKGFGYIFSEVMRPGLPNLRPRIVEPGGGFSVGSIRFDALLLDHGRTESLGFRISNADGKGPVIAYCLDCKRVPEETVRAIEGVDILVLDMLREREHPTHLSLEEALAVVERVKPGQTWFGHMAHEVDHATMEAKLPPNVHLAYDGLVLPFG